MSAVDDSIETKDILPLLNKIVTSEVQSITLSQLREVLRSITDTDARRRLSQDPSMESLLEYLGYL